MATIDCPHCEAEIEVPDVSGIYTCPLCDADFDFDLEESQHDLVSSNGGSVVFGIFFILFFAFWIWGMLTGEPCDNCGGGP